MHYMNLKCFFGSHQWNGCKCSKCGKTRDAEHDWSKDCNKCDTCGKLRTGSHEGGGCKCVKCGKMRDEEHDWSSDCEQCAECGKLRPKAHEWSGCKCKNCRKINDGSHAWINLSVESWRKCATCGKTESAKPIPAPLRSLKQTNDAWGECFVIHFSEQVKRDMAYTEMHKTGKYRHLERRNCSDYNVEFMIVISGISWPTGLWEELESKDCRHTSCGATYYGEVCRDSRSVS